MTAVPWRTSAATHGLVIVAQPWMCTAETSSTGRSKRGSPSRSTTSTPLSMRTTAEPERTWIGAASGEMARPLSSSSLSSIAGGSHGANASGTLRPNRFLRLNHWVMA
jgi:hypothetical protein